MTVSPGPNPDADLIEDHLRWLAGRRSPKTVRTYARVLWSAHRELPTGVPTAAADEITAWIAGRCRTADSWRTYAAAFRSFARWAVDNEHISRNEAVLVRRPPQPESLPSPCSDEQLTQILTRLVDPGPAVTDRPRAQLWSLCAAYLGCRCVEISRLHRDHITPDRGTLLHGKRDKLRRVPTHPLVWAAVAELPPGPLVPRRWIGDGDRISGHLRWRYLQAGVDVTAHQLRHWYGTTLVSSGAQIEEVQKLMGHSRISTTLGYVLVASPRLRQAVLRLPDLTAAAGGGQG